MKMLQSCHIKIKNFLTWVAIYGQTRFWIRDRSYSQWKIWAVSGTVGGSSDLRVSNILKTGLWVNPTYVGFPGIWDGPVKSDGCFNQWMEQLSAVGSIIKIKKNKYMCICIKSLMAYILYKPNIFFKEKIISSSIHSMTYQFSKMETNNK